eukprot:2211314-Rhodomonas_salina.1
MSPQMAARPPQMDGAGTCPGPILGQRDPVLDLVASCIGEHENLRCHHQPSSLQRHALRHYRCPVGSIYAHAVRS